jgi:outer membrane receptor for ferrienterochelin and colicin
MKLLTLPLVVALIAVTAMPAGAQSTTGTISGRIVDSQGLPVPGVTIVATSPNLQGTREAVSTENGDFILSLLPSGVYTLVFELSGFGTQTRTVTVAPTQVVPLQVEMGPAAVTETVEVTARAADVLTRTAQVATNFTQELISNLPTSRDLNASLMLAPSVHPTGPAGSYSIAGSQSFESLFLVNGVTVNENIRGQAYDLYIEDAIQETTVATAGVSAEYGRFGGGVVNVITKSGGNTFSGSFRDTLNNDKWRRLTPFEESADGGVGGGTDLRVDNVVPTYEYTLGGPILRDRLWFFTAGRIQKQESGRNTAITGIPYNFTDDTKRFEIKGTFALDANHRFQSAYTKHLRTQENNTFNQNLSMDVNSLGTRETPEELFTANYTGVLGPSFIGSGSRFTDLERGTLLIDRARGNTRYWTDTFCGVCDPEKRDNDDFYVKGTYFLSTNTTGTHTLTFGYDLFNDKRFANNHQSGSDYRILGTTSIITGSGASQQIFPQFLGDGTTIIQWNPIPIPSRGSNFRTHSAFFNDSLRLSDRMTLNLGLRWDKNDGEDQEGKTVVTSNAWSPRLGVIYDPTGRGEWTVTASAARYVAAVLQSIADASSAAGNPETRQFLYGGPDINPPGASELVTPDVAIRQVFDWFFANGGPSLPLNGNPVIPGVSTQIGDLSSPYTWEYAAGISRAFGSRASVRADFIYRDYHDFYIDRNAPGQIAQDAEGRTYDLTLVGNEDELLKRRYTGLTLQGLYRFGSRVDVGGTYTLSRNWGNVGTLEGETVANGPIRFDYRYAEYKQASWNFPEGDLPTDQRHRGRLWLNYHPRADLTVSVLQLLESGVPYGAANSSGVDPRPYVTNPGYLVPPPGTLTTYYFTDRDAFRTEGQVRTDLAVNYARRIPGAGRLELFGQLQILNLFNQSQLCACGGTIFGTGSGGNAGGVNIQRIDTTVQTPVTTASLQAFNPFTETPVEGVNWRRGPNFGRAVSRFAYTTPQSMRLSFGVRF